MLLLGNAYIYQETFVYAEERFEMEQALSNQRFQNKLTLWHKLGYAIGGFGTDIASNVISFYLIYYLVTVANIPPATAGLLVGLPKVFLIALDPVMGALSDRMCSRFGRRRFFLMICGPLSGLLLYMQFSAPELDLSLLVVFWWVVQFAQTANLSMLMVSYNAMEAELSPSSIERMQLVSMRQAFGIIGTLVGSALTLPVVAAFGGGKQGFTSMGAVFGVLVVFSFLTVVSTTSAEPLLQECPSFWKETRVTLKLRPFWLQLGVIFLCNLATAVNNAILVFYIDYVHGLASILPLALMLSSMVGLVSLLGWNWLCRRWDRRLAFTTGLLMNAVVLLCLRFVPERNMTLLWPLAALSGIGSAAICIFPRAMLTDVVSYDRAIRGRSRAGNIVGLWGLGSRAGLAIGNTLVGWLLALVGYSGGASVSPQLQEGLRMILGYVPSAFCLAVIPLLAFFTLSRTEMKRVEETLSQQTQSSEITCRY
jgi:GPH family glycoside/pentoside/hexuronide:cation symporter